MLTWVGALGGRSFQCSEVGNGNVRAGKMAQGLRVLSALAESPNSILSTHVR